MGSSDGSGGAAQGAMQTSLQNQGLSANQINQNSQSLTSQAGMLNSPLPATMSGISSAIASGGNQQGTTGVNQNAIAQQVTGYETNTGNTNLSKAQPALNNFYSNEMTQGLNQQTQQNAQSQVQQNTALQEAQLKNSAAPGTNQTNALQQLQNSGIQQSTNLAGNLAGQNQTAMQQGATGLASTAGTLDTQTMNMLQNALSGGEGINSTTLQNLISVLGLGTASAGQAATDTTNANQAQGGLFTGYSGQATQFGTQAASNSQSSGLGGILGSAAGLFSPIKL